MVDNPLPMHIRLDHVSQRYGDVRILDDISLHIPSGRFAVLVGASGSGKSTLLNLIGAVDLPSQGHLFLGDIDTSSLNETALTRIRRTSIGFIFQFFHLIPTLTVAENVAFPLALNGIATGEAEKRAKAGLADVGLQHRLKHFPNELSGGEMQRVAIARAVINRPPLLLADEPTGNLDSENGHRILELIESLHRSYRPTIVMATHSAEAAAIGDTIITISDGRIQSQS